MLDVGFFDALKIVSGVRTVDATTHPGDDLRLDGLRVAVVVAAIRGTAVFRRDDQAAPRLGRGKEGKYRSDEGETEGTRHASTIIEKNQ